MSRLQLGLALCLPLVMAACCDEGVQARAFVGKLTESECARKIDEGDAPLSIICPGSEVTICWKSSGVDSTTITVSPDPNGDSHSYGAHGALVLKPSKDTTIDIKASDCASTTKKVMVLDEPKPATFEGHLDASCNKINYRLNPAFVDPKVDAVDVTALFAPIVTNADGTTGGVCPTPPFLDGNHPIELFFFQIPNPFLTTRFSRPLKAIEDWNYIVKATCLQGPKVCNTFAALPFAMTLQCPAGG